MEGIGRAHPAGERGVVLIFFAAEMAGRAGEIRGEESGVILGFAFVAPDHAVGEVVAVAGRAGEAGLAVDVALIVEFPGPGRGGRMAGQAGRIPGRVGDVEKRLVLRIEQRPVVFDERGDRPFRIVGIGTVGDVPSPGQPRGDAADFAQTRGRRRRPAEIFP